MELSFAKCESIVNTLPIGFYTGRRIAVTADKTAETSYYDPMQDKIVISYPIIAQRLKNVADGSCTEEEAVRSMTYHEVSHAILTPTNGNLRSSFQVNCMEDERIETVLKDYFHGVNFRKQLIDLYNGELPKATDAKSAFYNAVRFGLGTGKVQKEVSRIIKKYASLNRGSERWGDCGAGYYEEEINDLYDLVKKEFKSNPEEFQPKSGPGKHGMKDMDKLADKQESSGDSGEQQKNKSENGNGEEEESEEEGEGMELSADESGEEHESPLSNEEIKRMVGASLSKQGELPKEQATKLENFQKSVEMIISNFNKKNKGGSGINAYSGVFNPRAVARKDYRYFERSMSTNGNNKFGTCHLNLIIDCSGSYCENVNITNGILAVLSEVERKNKNFSMDVAFINHEFHLCQNVSERRMSAWGGNSIPENMKEILMKLQKPQTCNYNIILFDGDACCNGMGGRDATKAFSVFDMKQTTLITDPDNEEYMVPPFTSTKVVVTQDYANKLIDHILHALTIAFG